MDGVNIAVIGTEGAGKSSFIEKALRLSRPPVKNVSSNQQDIEGIPFWVTIIELDVESTDVDPNRPLQWPKQMDGHIISRVDGALILYDVMNKDSIRELPPIICKICTARVGQPVADRYSCSCTLEPAYHSRGHKVRQSGDIEAT
jgi:GTPase SAR1 family protein